MAGRWPDATSASPPGERGGGVLLLGAGGLGCAVALGLVAAGVRRLVLADGDRLDLSNLHRQILYRMDGLGRDKAPAAAAALRQLNPALTVTVIPRRLERAEAIAAAAAGCRVVVDGSDNFATRFAANDAAFLAGIPLVHGAVTALRGQLLTILPGESACLRCLFGGPPAEGGATCASAGVLGPAVGEVGWLMALEAVRLLSGLPPLRAGRLLTLDFAGGRRREVPLPRQRGCPLCGGA